MMRLPSRFKITLAALLPLLCVWVSVACLAICLEDCAEEEKPPAIASWAGSFATSTEVVIDAGHEDCCCPVPESPAGALQKSYVYPAPENGGHLLVLVGTDLLTRSVNHPLAGARAATAVLKPPLARLCALRI